jgi:gliding motility-associated-like protein
MVQLLVLISVRTSAQCIIINEVLVNAAGNCDGSCVPNTAEWVELYNTCGNSVNIGCFVLTDGDFSVTFPPNTVLAANDYLVVGSNNSGVSVDVNLSTCNCTSGAASEIGIFTNGNEQIALANAAGQIVDGIFWGNGQFTQTPSFTTDALFGCGSHTITLSASNPVFTEVPTSDDGQTVYRSCANPEIWLSDGANYTPGAANGNSSGNITITSSDTTPCAGEAVTLTAQGATGPIVWSTGATSNSITVLETGDYSLSSVNSGGCGSAANFHVTYSNATLVDAGPGGFADCEDGIQLQGSTLASNFFWEPTAGLDNPQSLTPIATPILTTTYTLHAIAGDCESTSSVVVVPECGNLKVPNVFTPNGDGFNDVFRPDGKGVAKYSLQIFDRWGNLIFESKQYNNGWNGKINNEPAASGTYYFLLMAKDAFGQSLVGDEVMEGELTLLR